MAKKPRNVLNDDVALFIDSAIEHLRKARDDLRSVEAHKAADAVKRALKSAEGARRHAMGLLIRQGDM